MVQYHEVIHDKQKLSLQAYKVPCKRQDPKFNMFALFNESKLSLIWTQTSVSRIY